MPQTEAGCMAAMYLWFQRPRNRFVLRGRPCMRGWSNGKSSKEAFAAARASSHQLSVGSAGKPECLRSDCAFAEAHDWGTGLA